MCEEAKLSKWWVQVNGGGGNVVSCWVVFSPTILVLLLLTGNCSYETDIIQLSMFCYCHFNTTVILMLVLRKIF